MGEGCDLSSRGRRRSASAPMEWAGGDVGEAGGGGAGCGPRWRSDPRVLGSWVRLQAEPTGALDG